MRASIPSSPQLLTLFFNFTERIKALKQSPPHATHYPSPFQHLHPHSDRPVARDELTMLMSEANPPICASVQGVPPPPTYSRTRMSLQQSSLPLLRCCFLPSLLDHSHQPTNTLLLLPALKIPLDSTRVSNYHPVSLSPLQKPPWGGVGTVSSPPAPTPSSLCSRQPSVPSFHRTCPWEGYQALLVAKSKGQSLVPIWPGPSASLDTAEPPFPWLFSAVTVPPPVSQAPPPLAGLSMLEAPGSALDSLLY